MVRSEMKGAGVGPVQLGTDNPLDLFRSRRRNENSEGSQNHGLRMGSEPDLCDSNFVHIGAARKQELRAPPPR